MYKKVDTLRKVRRWTTSNQTIQAANDVNNREEHYILHIKHQCSSKRQSHCTI